MNYIGVDLGGTNIVVGLVDEDGKIIKSLNRPTNKERAVELIFDDIFIDRSELSDEEKELVDILINETDIYINIIDAENDSEEKDERQP